MVLHPLEQHLDGFAAEVEFEVHFAAEEGGGNFTFRGKPDRLVVAGLPAVAEGERVRLAAIADEFAVGKVAAGDGRPIGDCQSVGDDEGLDLLHHVGENFFFSCLHTCVFLPYHSNRQSEG